MAVVVFRKSSRADSASKYGVERATVALSSLQSRSRRRIKRLGREHAHDGVPIVTHDEGKRGETMGREEKSRSVSSGWRVVGKVGGREERSISGSRGAPRLLIVAPEDATR